MTDLALIAKMSRMMVTPILLNIFSDYHNWVRDADLWFCFSQIFYDIDSDILQHW